MKILIASVLIMVVGVLGIGVVGCVGSADEGFACFGDNGTSNHCWESPSDSNQESCENQGRIFDTGSCPDNGYTVSCGDYFVPPGGSCI